MTARRRCQTTAQHQLQRVELLNSVAQMISALDTFDPETEPEVILAVDSGKLIVTFNGSEKMAPIILDLPSMEN